MISAIEALQLDKAEIKEPVIDEVRDMMTMIEDHIRVYMTFPKPTPLIIPYKRMSKEAWEIIAFLMTRFAWNANANISYMQSRFQGGQPVPEQWILQFTPTPKALEELLANFEVTPKQLLA